MDFGAIDMTIAAFIGGGAAVVAFLGILAVGVGHIRTIDVELRPNDGRSLRDVIDRIDTKLDAHTTASDEAHNVLHDRIDHAFAELGRR